MEYLVKAWFFFLLPATVHACLGRSLITSSGESKPLFEEFVSTLNSGKSACERFDFVPRSEWNAQEPKSKSSIQSTANKVFLYHTITAKCGSIKWCTDELRDIQNYHMSSRGYQDIGYNFLLGNDYRVYEGRGWDVAGEHTQDYNSQSYAIAFLGNYMRDKPDRAALRAAENLIKCGIEKGKISSDYLIYGHRDVKSTDCHDDKLYEAIKDRFRKKYGGVSNPLTTMTQDTCDPDSACHYRDGICQRETVYCSGKYQSMLCSGTRKCCLPSHGFDDSACAIRDGICQKDSLPCDGAYQSNMCDGEANRRCCVPVQTSTDADAGCIAKSGQCQEDSLQCSGGYQSGLCSGAATRRCCLPGNANPLTTAAPATGPACDRFELVPRADWGAVDPKSTSTISSSVNKIFIHHTAGSKCMGKEACYTVLQGIQNYHMTDPDRNYNDIAYSFLVGEDGRIYEGRGWNVVGSHTQNYNSVSYGISFMGNYMDYEPGNNAIQAAQNLIACGIEKGKVTSDYVLQGHRDVKSTTECPGTYLYQEIQGWPHYGPDYACQSKNGQCQDEGQTCDGGYVSGLCSGAANIKCCLSDQAGTAQPPATEAPPPTSDKILVLTAQERNNLEEQLKIDEGVEYVIYLDSLNLPTFGIGHLIKESDPEYGKPVGTAVSAQRVSEAFTEDLQQVLKDVYQWSNDCNSWPSEVKEIIANMMFNMGLTRLNGFQKLKAAVQARDWNEAANQMADSVWAAQVKSRATRLIDRMRAVAGTADASPGESPETSTASSKDPDVACHDKSGQCQDESQPCAGGYESGLCSGASNIRCCLPGQGDTPQTHTTEASSTSGQMLSLTTEEMKRLEDQLKIDEGVKYEIYLDTEDLPTFGIGHLIKATDPEYNLPVGTPVSEERVSEAFTADVQQVLKDVYLWSNDCNSWPSEVKEIIANMMFNLGLTRLNGFLKLKAAVQARDWNEAANQMADSKWAGQVKDRATRLIDRMRALAGTADPSQEQTAQPTTASSNPDAECMATNGQCQEESQTCSGIYKTGLCGGAASRKCCVPASELNKECQALQGSCQVSSSPCGGYYQSLLCPDSDTSFRCCVPQLVPGSCPEAGKQLACNILEWHNAGQIVLMNIHPSGKTDNAFALNNIQDTCEGLPASLSNYTCSECASGPAPGGRVCLSATVLQYLHDLGNTGEIIVNELAGACHSCTSKHYLGKAVDLNNKNTRVAEFLTLCTSMGGWGQDEGTHVHCQFP